MTNRSSRRGEQAALAHDFNKVVALIGHPSREYFIMARSPQSAPFQRPEIWMQPTPLAIDVALCPGQRDV